MRTLFATLVLFATLSPVVQAQDSRLAYLRQFDTNGDGRVSEAEYVTRMSRGFLDMDRNGDGIISVDELPGGHGKPVTRASFQNNLRRQFRRLDRNHDGYLNARELTAPPR